MTTRRLGLTSRRLTVLAGVLLLVIAMLVVLVARASQEGATLAPALTSSAAEPFSPSSPFRTAIPADAAVDPASPAMVAYATRNGPAGAALIQYAIPVWTATADSPRYSITCTAPAEWGTCPFAGLSVPVPAEASPHSGTDGAMTVVDQQTRKVYEFWQAHRTGAGWQTTWGAVNDLDGSGWGGSSTGAGASRLAGLVRTGEIESGAIPHALVAQTDNVCQGVVRRPALKSDGTSTRPDCVPEGSRLRLDPSLDVAALPDMTDGERAVARALQVYGAFVIDRGDSPLSFSFELAHDATPDDPGTAYREAGLSWDHFAMKGIPWDRLQVVAP